MYKIVSKCRIHTMTIYAYVTFYVEFNAFFRIEKSQFLGIITLFY